MKSFRTQEQAGQSSEAGITLVELLVAMAIGLILAGGIFQVFVGSSDSYQMTTQLSRVQENGRFAMQIMRQEIRGAGYLGCAQDASPGKFQNMLNHSSFYMFAFGRAIYGIEATGSDAWADDSRTFTKAQLAAEFGIVDPLDNSDIVVVRGAEGGGITMYTDAVVNAANIKVLGAAGVINKNDIVMLSDCSHTSVFQVTNYNPANKTLVAYKDPPHKYQVGDEGFPGNETDVFQHTYEAGSEIVKVRSMIFYVRMNNANPAQPSLYMKEGNAAAVELVEGVEMMQVRYGEDTNNDGTVNAYFNADEVADWANVRSVRIGLLLRTVAEMGRGPFDNQTYDVSGDGNDDFGPAGDRRLRLVMSGTVGLRNQLR